MWVTRLRPIGWPPRISIVSVLALLCLVSWTAAAQETDERPPAAIAPQGAQLTFQTLDGDTQQVNPEEIWRIRATSTSDEPPGAIVIDYAFERVYVKEKSRQRGGEGGRRTAFKEIYPASRRASLHRCHQGDRRHPRHPARCLTRMPMRSSSRAKARPRFRKRAKRSAKRWEIGRRFCAIICTPPSKRFAAEGFTHIECFCPRCRVIRLRAAISRARAVPVSAAFANATFRRSRHAGIFG